LLVSNYPRKKGSSRGNRMQEHLFWHGLLTMQPA
jgi:hypothetical protein